uniref:DUS-like FMN-binding domain-containing protein n=1 Tax=Quercus lobata TaxID=97700 RepID=A0A7N2MRV0_QUELO
MSSRSLIQCLNFLPLDVNCITNHASEFSASWFKLAKQCKIVVSLAITEATYTPMLHSHIFTETEKYRDQEFTTCKEDRPLFVPFCANDPDILLEAAKRVEPFCDYVDINLG